MKKIDSLVSTECRPLTGGEALHTPIPEMTTAEAATAWTMLDFIEDRVKARKEALRERLLEEVKNNGSQTDKGGSRLMVEGVAQIIREARVAKVPSEEDLRTLLHAKAIDPSEAFTQKVTEAIDPSKLAALVATGKLKEEEIKVLLKTVWAMKVHPAEALNALLKTAEARYIEEGVTHGAPPALPEPAKPTKKRGAKPAK